MKIKKALFVLIPLAVLGILAVTWGWRGQHPGTYGGPFEKIRLGAVPDTAALIYVAEGCGFFRGHGLDVTIKNYEAGILGMKDFAGGEVDITPISEFVLVNQIFKGVDLKCLGAIVRGKFSEIIGRKDQGIEKEGDLKGKKIGSVRGSSLDFFLEAFLTSHGIRLSDVKVMYSTPTETADAIMNGTIDAAAHFNPHSDTIKKGLGTNAVTWPIQGQQDSYMLLIGKSSFIKEHPSAVERLLAALIDAEQFMGRDEARSQTIVAERLKMDRLVLASIWQRYFFNLRLDQDLLSLMEDQARWMIRNKVVNTMHIPNYFDYMYLDGLEKVKPEAITVIH
jgi:ABC-type nitrate/sulfonate/bicarbonate transport system substrate-binding protein